MGTRDPHWAKERSVTAAAVRDFARQFQGDDVVDGVLRILENCEVVGRSAIVHALDGFLRDHDEFRGATLCLFGTLKDSGAITSYYANDIAPTFDMPVGDLPQALASGRPILFIDDFIGTGAQAVSIFEAWLGADPTIELNEDREASQLVPQLVDALRERSVALVYPTGWSLGVRRLRHRARELGLRLALHVDRMDENLPLAFGRGIFEDAQQEDAVRSECERIGKALLVSRGTHLEAWAAERALGYGNQGLLLVFPYNTPSQTLTCLWSPGTLDGLPWRPIFPRRTKR